MPQKLSSLIEEAKTDDDPYANNARALQLAAICEALVKVRQAHERTIHGVTYNVEQHNKNLLEWQRAESNLAAVCKKEGVEL